MTDVLKGLTRWDAVPDAETFMQMTDGGDFCEYEEVKELVERLTRERDRARELEESAKAMTRRLQDDLSSTQGPLWMDAHGRLKMVCPKCGEEHLGPETAQREEP